MKSILKALSVAAIAGAMVLPVLADDAATTPPADQKDLKKIIENEGINYVETAQKGITLSGYVDTSYTEQFAGTGEYGQVGNTGSGPANVHAALRQFDTSNNTFNVNAVKLALEKALPDKNEWAAGFRIDMIYGSDAKYLGDSAFQSASNYTEGTGSNYTGMALEQALVKFRVPVGNGLDFYMGKFVTFLGYEVIESPANLNFSRGLLFTNAIPLTHTGVYADYKFNDTVEAKLGVVDGWNNSTSSSVGNPADEGYVNRGEDSFGKAITGQVTVTAPGKNANITQSFIYSPEGEPGVIGVNNGPIVVYDIWGNWSPTFVKDNALLLGFNIDLGYNGDSGPNTWTDASSTTLGPCVQPVNDSNTWWGAALYASYKFNKVFTLSGRLEYLHSDAAWYPKFGPSGGVYSTSGVFEETPAQDDYSATLTATFNIWDNLLTRIEYRCDDLCGASTSYYYTSESDSYQVIGKSSVQHEISLNAVYSF